MPLPATIEECHVLIAQLVSTVSALTSQVEILKLEITQLKEKLNQNSNNSSKPPSQDFKSNKKKKSDTKLSSGRKTGGQPGHKGMTRELLNISEVDKIEKCILPLHCRCGGKILKHDNYYRWQVHELPIIKMHVTEYQCEKGRCAACRLRYTAALPQVAKNTMIGPRLMSLMAMFPAKYHVSRQLMLHFLKEIFDFKVSLGTVFNKEKKLANMTTPVCEDILNHIKNSAFLHADETGIRENGHSSWLWTFSSKEASYFKMADSRGTKVLKDTMADYEGVVISDRYGAYNLYDDVNRQLCWAHLKRDFKRISESQHKVIARIGAQLLTEQDKLFEHWHGFKKGLFDRQILQDKCKPIINAVENLLESCTYLSPEFRAVGTCKNILKHSQALWTFLYVEGIEPTNNHAEQQIRPSVIWEKISFGSRSKTGSLFIANLSTLLATCKKQGKNSWRFLQDLIISAYEQGEMPQLVESPSHPHPAPLPPAGEGTLKIISA